MNVATPRRSSAGVREVKNHLSAYLERVKLGEEIVITDRGEPVARLTSVGPDVDQMQALIDQGIVIPATAPRSLPARRVRVKGSLTDLVADQRR
jgi:prevent-host-death family protein